MMPSAYRLGRAACKSAVVILIAVMGVASFSNAHPSLRDVQLAQYSDTASAPAQSCLSFPRACLARTRNPESSAWTGEKDRDSPHGSLSGTGFQPVSLTGWKPVPLENDGTNLRHELSYNYTSQLSISVLLASPSVVAGLLAGFKPAYTVTINVQRFESVMGDAALVDAVWAVRSVTGGKTEPGRTIPGKRYKASDSTRSPRRTAE
jgi:hypothetical protein